MKIWKLTEEIYGIKEYLSKDLFNKLISIKGVKYNKEAWRIEFREDKLDIIKKLFSNIQIMKGQDLLDRLYRINKFKSRKELMRYAVVIYEVGEYIYFILKKEEAGSLLEDYSGIFVIHDPKVKRYAQEMVYLNQQQKLTLYEEQQDNWSIKDIIEVLDQREGSLLFNDIDSSPFLFLHYYKDIEITQQKINKLFKQELSRKNITPFNLKKLAEKRRVSKEIWYPIFEKLIVKEIKKRKSKLEALNKRLGLQELFTNQQAIKLGNELEVLSSKINQELKVSMGNQLAKEYFRARERIIYGI